MAAGAPGAAPPAVLSPESTRRRKLLLVIVIAVVAIVIIAAIGFILLQPAPTGGPQLASVQLTASPKSLLNQTETVVITASARDTNGVDQTANVTWTWSAAPSTAVRITQTALASRITVKGIESGTVTVTGQATLGTSGKSGTATLAVEAIRILVGRQGPAAPLGESFDIPVTIVKPPANTTFTGYSGTVRVSSTDPNAMLLSPVPPPGTPRPLPGNVTFSPALQGVAIFRVGFGTYGMQTLTVTDTEVPTVTGSVQVQGDRRPVADFKIQPDPTDRRIVTFTSNSTDPDNDAITSSNWEFGDGTTGAGASVVHTYTVTIEVTVNLTVTDVWGLPSARRPKMYTPSAPPSAFFVVNGTQAVPPDIRVWVDARGSTGAIQTYNWTWGDGKQSQSMVGTAFHDYGPAYAGTDVNIVLNVTDVYGLWDTFPKTVRVTTVPLPPVANFTITNVDNVTLRVWVDGGNSSDPNADIAKFRWDWGDGNFTEKGYSPANFTAAWQYLREGDYAIKLTVTDSTGLFDFTSKPVSLFRPALPPVAAFASTKAAFRVDVDASASTDPNGPSDIVAYNWTWGDGAQNEFPTSTATHTYAPTPALYTITLKVRDTTGKIGTATRKVSVAATTFDYTFWDFFNVPFKDYWDYRGEKYGDLPFGVECFNASSAALQVCADRTPSTYSHYTAPPYTNWYPAPGNIRPGHPGNNPFIYAPYRWKVIAANIPNYNVSEPVFLPVLNYAAVPYGSSYINFEWRFGYLTIADKAYLQPNCGVFGFNDGFDDTSNVTLTMDLKTSARLFGADISSVAAARTWWNNNANDNDCTTTSPLEARWGQWYLDMGGTQRTTGKYDVANGCEWYYVDFMTQVSGTVDNDGTTHVRLWNVGYCQEILLTRWFYWGNTSYIAHWDDSTQARGWWGMELAWFEDLVFTGTLTGADMDFSLTTVMQYHFQQEALPGPDGQLDKVGDVPIWSWRPFLTDYTNDWNPSSHYISELDRYPTETYMHSTPGSPDAKYGKLYKYDYAPVTWSPKAGEEWHFIFPKGDVIFYDPRTAAGADPTQPFTTDPTVKAYIRVISPLVYNSTRPAAFGEWDSVNMTWDIYGPVTPPLGPDGSPGNYALDGTVKPRIQFRNATAAAAGAVSNPTVGDRGSALFGAAAPAFGAEAFVGTTLQANLANLRFRRESL